MPATRASPRLGGGRAIVTSEYPARQPDFQSALLEVVHAAYLEVHGRVPHMTAVHAGLEAGEIAAHLPGLVSQVEAKVPTVGSWISALARAEFRKLNLCPPQCGRGPRAWQSSAVATRQSVCDAYASHRTRASRHYVK
jgi:hypothetical protein